jgi:uncharacterized SAM-binding protein YcdF (DUF218 family)
MLMLKRRLRVAATVLALGFAGAAWALDAYGHAQKARESDVIIVLGARVLENGKPSNALRERVAQAVALHKAGIAPFILCTGGLGDNPPTEAQAGKELAQKLGVPASQVLEEDRSDSTPENARFAARICRERGWKSVVLVSQPYHLWRARRLFEREGLLVSTSPTPLPRVDDSWWTRALQAAREAILSVRDGFF